MNTTILYRKGTSDDIASFLAFFKQQVPLLFTEYSPNALAFEIEVDFSPSWLTEKISKGSKKIFLSLNDGDIIGFIFAGKPIAGVAYADWLGVNKDFQKKGVASSLLSFWEKDAFEEGSHALQLWTSKHNISFYENRGFINGGLFPKAWHGIDSYLMYKPLREPEEKNYLKSYLEQIKKG